MSAVSIRPATPADVAAITRIYAHAVKHGTASFELDPPDEAEMARRQRTLLDSGYPYLVAEIDGALAGYAYAGPYRPRPAYRFSVEDSIYIDPHAQRRGVGRVLLEHLIEECERRGFRQMIAVFRGVGRVLLEHLIEECERRGFRQMIAVIGDSAQIASIELHRALGFRMIGAVENVGYKFGRWLDTVRSEEHTSELQSRGLISYAVF